MKNYNLIVNEQNTQLMLDIDGSLRPLPPLWLRERCSDEKLVDKNTGQRLFNPHELPENLTITSMKQEDAGRVWLEFSDGVSDRFNIEQIISEIFPQASIPEPVSWKSDIKFPYYDWNQLSSPKYKLETLECFFRNGFIVVKNTPVERDAVLRIAEEYGFVRKTNFGEYFEVYSRPNANDLAYTSHALAPHTDNPYRDPVPGIQLLHCLINNNPGGFSTLVDSLAVCERLKAEDPEGFELLCNVSVRFQFIDSDFEIADSHPLICKNHQGEITGIHYSPRLDYMPLMSEDDTHKYQRARKRLGHLFSDSEYEIRFPLKQGEVMIFDNNRVLHGRTSFDVSKGERHLQGCYIDRDTPRSLYKKLVKKAAS